jgi:hypothetical protein
LALWASSLNIMLGHDENGMRWNGVLELPCSIYMEHRFKSLGEKSLTENRLNEKGLETRSFYDDYYEVRI